jgi:hypothetical protein
MIIRKLSLIVLCQIILFFIRVPCYAYADKDFSKLEKIFHKSSVAKGDFIVYSKDDEVKYSAKVLNKVLNGNAIVYYPTKKLKKKAIYKKGLLDGNLELYSKDGKILERLNLKQGLLNGKSQYFKNGVIRSEINFKDDIKHGQYKLFNKKGLEIENGLYANGNVINKQFTKIGQEEKAKCRKWIRNITIGVVSVLLIAGLIIAVANSGSQKNSNYYSSSGYQYAGFKCNQSLEGCCSYHSGILISGYTPDGTVIPATINSRVVCNDRQLSPTCYCYAN